MNETPEDDFSSFFSAALTGDPEPSPEPTPEPPAEPIAELEPKPVPEEPTLEEPAPEEPAPVVAAVPDPSEALRAELAQLKAEIERLRTQPTPVEPAPTPVDPDAEVLAEFADEWPGHHKAVQAMIRQAVADAVGGLAQQLKPTVQSVQRTELTKLHDEIRTLEPDFDKLATPVAEWVKGIPDSMAGLRQGMIDALWPTNRPASAQEIAQVFKMYRAWNPGAAPVTQTTPEPAATPTPQQPKPTRSNVRDILKTMAPVSSRPVAPAADPDEDDFGSNFAQALRSV